MKKIYFQSIFPATIAVAAIMIILGVAMEDDPSNILPGLVRIISMQDLLITDYVSIGGIGAAMVNSGLVMIISVCIVKFSGDPFNGLTIVEMGLMAGFSLFGKNILNIWPFILGTWLYAKYQREPFSKHVGVALMATSLAPLVSYLALGSIHASIPLGIAAGVVVGFLLPPLSAYTYKIQNGLNLYNMGFACGLLAMMIVPVLTAFGDKPDSALHWAHGYEYAFTIILSFLCVSFILAGFFAAGVSPGQVWVKYRQLLATSGRSPSDYLLSFGGGPVLVNIGVNGLIAMAYLYIIGGQINGPTLGGIFTIMGFSATGKHARNIIPVMIGVALGAYGMHQTPDYPALQLAGLFGTTLAPISGYFGWPFGILAGFIHSALVLQTGGPVAGLNLYNNGFSGGLIAIVLYPIITAVLRHRQPQVQKAEYYDLFRVNAPVDAYWWHSSHKGQNERDVPSQNQGGATRNER